jgi:hypothetical protein
MMIQAHGTVRVLCSEWHTYVEWASRRGWMVNFRKQYLGHWDHHIATADEAAATTTTIVRTAAPNRIVAFVWIVEGGFVGERQGNSSLLTHTASVSTNSHLPGIPRPNSSATAQWSPHPSNVTPTTFVDDGPPLALGQTTLLDGPSRTMDWQWMEERILHTLFLSITVQRLLTQPCSESRAILPALFL